MTPRAEGARRDAGSRAARCGSAQFSAASPKVARAGARPLRALALPHRRGARRRARSSSARGGRRARRRWPRCRDGARARARAPAAMPGPVARRRLPAAGAPDRAAGSCPPLAQEPPKETFEAKTIGPAEKIYTGHPISLDFKDGDLQDIFRLFADISGLNVVVNPGVSGKVTLKLTEVPWDQALDLILKTNGLGYTIDDNVIRIAQLSRPPEGRAGPAQAEGEPGAGRRPRDLAEVPLLREGRGPRALGQEGRPLRARQDHPRHPHQHDDHHRPAGLHREGQGPDRRPRPGDAAGGDRGADRRDEPQLHARPRHPVGLPASGRRRSSATPRTRRFPHSIILNGQGTPSQQGLPADQGDLGADAGDRDGRPRLRRQPAGRGLQLGHRASPSATSSATSTWTPPSRRSRRRGAGASSRRRRSRPRTTRRPRSSRASRSPSRPSPTTR